MFNPLIGTRCLWPQQRLSALLLPASLAKSGWISTRDPAYDGRSKTRSQPVKGKQRSLKSRLTSSLCLRRSTQANETIARSDG